MYLILILPVFSHFLASSATHGVVWIIDKGEAITLIDGLTQPHEIAFD